MIISKTNNGKTLINGIEFQYVSGSLGKNFRLSNRDKEIEEEHVTDFNNLILFIQKKLKGYFVFSTLLNAYTETTYAKLLKKNNNLNHTSVYSDSGGLQVLTAGKEIDDNLKKEVYKIQAEYSDFAMNFDEMPIKVVQKTGAETLINGDEGIIYIDELIEPCSITSAKNIQTQIKVFSELNAKTKIFPILHGYDPDSFIKYATTLFENIGNTKNYINGLAIASLRGHSDGKVGLMKMFDYVSKILNNPNIPSKYLNHIHLLGVARYQRIIPILMLIKKGLLPKEIKTISFDSTAITKSYVFGKIYQNVDQYKNPKDFSNILTLKDYKFKSLPHISEFYRNVFNLFKDYDNCVFTSWEDLANHSPNNGESGNPTKQFAKYGKDFQRKYLAQVRYSGLYHAYTYLSILEAFIDDELSLDSIFGYNNTIKYIFETFETAKTLEDINSICDYFYTTAKRGRTDLRIKKCKTIDEFNTTYSLDHKCLLNQIGINKHIEILDERLKKPWIGASIKKAKKSVSENDPTKFLF